MMTARGFDGIVMLDMNGKENMRCGTQQNGVQVARRGTMEGGYAN